jgi:hypothetical protein
MWPTLVAVKAGDDNHILDVLPAVWSESLRWLHWYSGLFRGAALLCLEVRTLQPDPTPVPPAGRTEAGATLGVHEERARRSSRHARKVRRRAALLLLPRAHRGSAVNPVLPKGRPR